MIVRFTLDEGRQELRACFLDDGESAGPFPLHLNRDRLSTLLRKLEGCIDNPYESLRAEMQAVGCALFQALVCSPEIEYRYRQRMATLAAFPNSRQVARIEIVCDGELAMLPWELMFDPLDKDHLLLTKRPRFSISRCKANVGPHEGRGVNTLRAPAWQPPLKILLILATPWYMTVPAYTELTQFDTNSFIKAVRQIAATAGPERIDFQILDGSRANPDNVEKTILYPPDGRGWDIVYYVGHGEIPHEDSTLIFPTPSGNAGIAVSEAEVARWVKPARVQSVILSACETLPASIHITDVAAISAVGIPMRFPMDSAMAFDLALLEALGAWRPLDLAVADARAAIMRSMQTRLGAFELTLLDKPDWALPFVFMHSGEARPDYFRVAAGDYPIGLTDEQLNSVRNQLDFPELLDNCVGSDTLLHLTADFWLARWPVTNAEYRYYLKQNPDVSAPPGFKRDATSGDVYLEKRRPSQPVVGVSWHDAIEYCKWVGGLLPEADEWEAAARGAGGTIFPWGDEFDSARAARSDGKRGGPESVFAHNSKAGPESMCGNVLEWTATATPHNGCHYVVGGAWNGPRALLLPSLRLARDSTDRDNNVGFRVKATQSG